MLAHMGLRYAGSYFRYICATSGGVRAGGGSHAVPGRPNPVTTPVLWVVLAPARFSQYGGLGQAGGRHFEACGGGREGTQGGVWRILTPGSGPVSLAWAAWSCT